MSRDVVDVSEANGVIDWPAVAKHVDAAIIRVGYRGYGAAGTLQTDKQFRRNIAEALAAGLPVGVYWCTQALSDDEAREEAAYVHGLIRDYKLAYPVYLDSEWMEPNARGRADQISKARRTQYALTWLQAMQTYGHTPGLYTGESWFTDLIDGPAIAKAGVAIWLAKYSGTSPRHPHAGWQYTDSATVPGISTRADLSHFYVDYATAEYRQAVQRRFGLEEATLDYLAAYKYGADLLRKLATGG